MAYTSQQLTMAWTAVHNGVAPDAATQRSLEVFANFNASGQFSDADTLSHVLNSGDDTTAVALLTYQFFTGKSPTKAGVDYLVHSDANPSDLSDAYYAKFNIENRYINFAANLGVNGDGAKDFAAKYGAMSFGDYVASIYETIIGSTYAKAAGVDVAAAVAYLVGTHDAVLATARDAGMVTPNMTPAQVELAVKAAMAGLVMAAAVKADIGIYAASANNFMLAMAQGKATYGADLVTTYGPASGLGSTGTGKALSTAPSVYDLPGGPIKPVDPPKPPVTPDPDPDPGPQPLHFTLTNAADHFTGAGVADTFTATHLTFNAGDVLDGAGGGDTLTLTAATGNVYTAPSATISSIETINLSNDAGVYVDATAWTGLTKLDVTAGGQVDAVVSVTADLIVHSTGGGDLQLTGGHDVTATAAHMAGGDISISDATGAVVVNREGATSNTTDIRVTGGASVSITQTAASGSAHDANVYVYGRALTTSVTTKGVAGATAAAVEIWDVNAASSTAAGTITSADVSGVDAFTFKGTALTTLKLAHASNDIIISNNAGGLTAGAATTLNLTLNDVADGANGVRFDEDGVYTTLNLTLGAQASHLAYMNFAAVTALSISGASKLTLDLAGGLNVLQTVTLTGSAALDADFGLYANVTAIDASGTSGANTLTIDAATAAFTGGSGADTLVLHSGTINKSIAMGGGNDTLYFANGVTFGSGVTVNGGGGTADVLAMSATDAATASSSGVFATKVTGFERLILTAPSNQTIDLAQLGHYHHVTTSGGDGLTLNGLAAGDTLVLDGAGGTGGYIVSGSAFQFPTDMLNVSLVDTAGAQLQFGKIATSGIQTAKITVTDGAPAAGHVEHLTWLANDLGTLTITGSGGLALTAAGTSLNQVDASGLTGAFSWTTGFSSSTATIFIKGSATGGNTIDASSVTHSFSYTGGSGADDITTHANYVNVDLGNGTNTLHAENALGSFNVQGGSGADTLYIPSARGAVDVGSGLDTIVFTSANPDRTQWTAITGMGAGDKIQVGYALGVTSFGAATDVSSYNDPTDAVYYETFGDGSTTPIVKWFVSGGDTYILIDHNAGGFSTGDYVIKLVGVTDLSHAAISGDTITL